jgi:heme/copper-type cytochrome/quinol oxidase subunit 1
VSSGPTIAPQRPELVTDALPASRPRWIELATSTDHKDIGRMFIGASLSFLVLGMVAYLLMRLQLAIPENTLIEPTTFNRLLSVGGTTMIMLFALPLAFGFFTYLVPLQIGARSVAFPRLANLSFWLYVLGGGVLYVSFVYIPPETGVNALPPLSSETFITNNGIDVWITAVGLATLGLLLQAVNLVATLRRMRAPGLAWRRTPLFSISAAVSSYVVLVAGAAMLAALTMLMIDRHFGGVFFESGEGGAPLYFQHLSWIFFSGAYAVMVLFAAGTISEIVPVFSGKPLLSRNTMAASFAAIGVLGLLAWMQNMFSAAIPAGFLYMAMAAAVLMLVPLGLLFFNWLATLVGGAIELRAPMLFALAGMSVLSFGLAGELMQSVIGVNWLLGSTTDSTACTGYVIVGGPILCGFAALHYWFPKLTGRVMGEGTAKASIVLIIVGAHLTFIPMVLAGLDGQPTDVYKYYENMDVGTYNLLSTIGLFVLVAGVKLTLLNAVRSVSRGVKAGPDPWGGETLEWLAPSPPPPHNFDVVPDVRSAEPLRDIRDAVRARGAAPTPRAESTEPVA